MRVLERLGRVDGDLVVLLGKDLIGHACRPERRVRTDRSRPRNPTGRRRCHPATAAPSSASVRRVVARRAGPLRLSALVWFSCGPRSGSGSPTGADAGSENAVVQAESAHGPGEFAAGMKCVGQAVGQCRAVEDAGLLGDGHLLERLWRRLGIVALESALGPFVEDPRLQLGEREAVARGGLAGKVPNASP